MFATIHKQRLGVLHVLSVTVEDTEETIWVCDPFGHVGQEHAIRQIKRGPSYENAKKKNTLEHLSYKYIYINNIKFTFRICESYVGISIGVSVKVRFDVGLMRIIFLKKSRNIEFNLVS